MATPVFQKLTATDSHIMHIVISSYWDISDIQGYSIEFQFSVSFSVDWLQFSETSNSQKPDLRHRAGGKYFQVLTLLGGRPSADRDLIPRCFMLNFLQNAIRVDLI